MIRITRITRITHALAALTATLLLSTAQAQGADDSLYRAWGEKAGIQAVMQDFVTRLQADARMAPFFKNACLLYTSDAADE